jgi:hypothetical protein
MKENYKNINKLLVNLRMNQNKVIIKYKILIKNLVLLILFLKKYKVNKINC